MVKEGHYGGKRGRGKGSPKDGKSGRGNGMKPKGSEWEKWERRVLRLGKLEGKG